MSGQIVYGQALFDGGEYEESRTVFENALAMDRENLVALRHLGDLALRMGETASARQWYEKLLEVDPKDAAVVALVNEIDAATEAQQPAATDADQTGAEAAEAAQAVTDEIAAEPEPTAATPPEPVHSDDEDKLLAEELGYPVPPAQVFVTETMAELYLAQGFRDRAVNVFRQLVALRPEDERLRNRLAELEGAAAAPEPAARAEAESPARTEFLEPAHPGVGEAEPLIEEPSLIEARREESASEEVPETQPAEVRQPSEEDASGDSISVDSPPDERHPEEPDSIEAPDSTETRSEPELVAAPLTVRDFFASIGRRRPSSRTNGSVNGSSSADAAADYTGPGSGDDARAAAALAGAFGHSAAHATPTRNTPTSAAVPAPGRESEEDVASFRAWLDGLTG